jgi:FkbM family methyltransferase
MPSFVETSRRVVRGAMPAAAYRALARRYGAWSSSRRIGFAQYRRLRAVAAADRLEEPVSFHPPVLRYPVWVRPGTTDALVFESNLAREGYACVPATAEAHFIVDAGANAGFASAYFLTRFPAARVVALEPEPSNFALAARNLAPYGERVTLLREALWHEATVLHLRTTAREDSASVEQEIASPGLECRGVDPLHLLERAQAERIDLLKIDIEGAEGSLFSHDPDEWIERTSAIVIEIHSEQAQRTVYDALERHQFRSWRNRDLHVFVRGEAACARLRNA